MRSEQPQLHLRFTVKRHPLNHCSASPMLLSNLHVVLKQQDLAMSLTAYLMEFKGNYGPHLIIVPNTVLVNWKNTLTHAQTAAVSPRTSNSRRGATKVSSKPNL